MFTEQIVDAREYWAQNKEEGAAVITNQGITMITQCVKR
jgi:hypothetical protein